MTSPWPDPDPNPLPTGPRTFPAASPLVPLTAYEARVGSTADLFPVRTDRALLGDDYVEVTPEACGVGDDPVAQVLYLRGLAAEIELGMNDLQRAELDAYERPALRAVA